MFNHPPRQELGRVSVRVVRTHQQRGPTYEEIEAFPEDYVPEVMKQEAWYGDRWRFSTVYARGIIGVIDTYREGTGPQMLVYTTDGYFFRTLEPDEILHGAGI